MEIESADLLVSKVLFAIAMIAFFALVILEKIRPYQRYTAKLTKDSYLTNTTAFLFNSIVMTLLKATSLYFVAQQFSTVGLLGNMGNHPIKWVLTFLLYDLAIYFWHWLSHKYEFLWRFHKVHHSDKSFNTTTGFRFHVFDLFLELVYKCLFVIVVGVEAPVVLAVEALQQFFIFFHHSNITFEKEKKVSDVIITPYLHRLHHSTLRSEHDSNYGIVLAFWDKLFGTRKERVPENIGLDIIVAENPVQLFFLAFITEQKIRKILNIIPKRNKKPIQKLKNGRGL